jgi:hypothetical protein
MEGTTIVKFPTDLLEKPIDDVGELINGGEFNDYGCNVFVRISQLWKVGVKLNNNFYPVGSWSESYNKRKT